MAHRPDGRGSRTSVTAIGIKTPVPEHFSFSHGTAAAIQTGFAFPAAALTLPSRQTFPSLAEKEGDF